MQPRGSADGYQQRGVDSLPFARHRVVGAIARVAGLACCRLPVVVYLHGQGLEPARVYAVSAYDYHVHVRWQPGELYHVPVAVRGWLAFGGNSLRVGMARASACLGGPRDIRRQMIKAVTGNCGRLIPRDHHDFLHSLTVAGRLLVVDSVVQIPLGGRGHPASRTVRRSR